MEIAEDPFSFVMGCFRSSKIYCDKGNVWIRYIFLMKREEFKLLVLYISLEFRVFRINLFYVHGRKRYEGTAPLSLL
jgi:hypothetical protein